MSIKLNLQNFSLDELRAYDLDPGYMFIPVNRDQLYCLEYGILKLVGDYVEAVDDIYEWVRFNRDNLYESGKVFILICQRKKLLDVGFVVPSIVGVQDHYEYNEKAEDGFEELRVNKDVALEPVGYCSLLQVRLRDNSIEGAVWRELLKE